MKKVVAIIPAAGSGKRMNESVNKQFLKIGDKTVIERTLAAFEASKQVSEVILVTKYEEIPSLNNIIKASGIKKVRSLVEGGAERQDSIYNGLKETRSDDDWILVHDGARPFITSTMIDEMVEALLMENEQQAQSRYKSLVMAVPSKDTVKRVKGNKVEETLNRSELFNIQTPQAFSRELLVESYDKAMQAGYKGTDDASIVEWMGHDVFIHMGSYENIKITTPDDLYLGEAILKKRGEI